MQSITVSSSSFELVPQKDFPARPQRPLDLRRKLRGQLRTEATPSGGWQWQTLEVAGMAVLGLATSQ